jgi:hypothetical protein
VVLVEVATVHQMGLLEVLETVNTGGGGGGGGNKRCSLVAVLAALVS